MSWGQPEEVPQQAQSWGNTEQTWGNNADQQQQDNKPAWGDSNNGQENKEFRGRGGRGGGRGRGDRGGRGRGGDRGGDRGGRGGRGRGRGNNENKEEGEVKPQTEGGGWGQQTQEGWGSNQQENKEPAQGQSQWGNDGNNAGGGAPTENAGGWGQQNTETQGWGGNQETNNQDGQQDQQKGKGRGKKRDSSPPPAKRVRPNPIVITVEDEEDSETQNIIINEYPVLQNKQKGLIKSEEQQICFEGNIKIDENNMSTQFISFDTEIKVKIDQIEDYTIENSKDLLKNIGDQIIVGIVQGVDKDNQKAINKLADNLLDKQQSIHFKDVSLFSIKQLYKGESASRLAFVKQIQV